MKMQDKVVVVTGGNSGIGRGIVHRFAQEQADVAIVGRDREKGEAVVSELEVMGRKSAFYMVDIASEQQVARLVSEVHERFGRIDIVVNNAGVGSRRCGVEESDPPGVRWRKLRGPNLDGTFFVSAYTLPVLAESGGGAMVNISSTAALHGNWGTYAVAKAGVEALTRSFAAEGAPHGVRVNGISPGWIETEQDETLAAAGTADGAWDMAPSLLNRMGTPREIANAVLFLASDQASFITGQTLIVDGGLTITDYPSAPMLSKVGHRLSSGPCLMDKPAR